MHQVSTDDLLLIQISSDLGLADQGSPSLIQHVVSVKSSSLLNYSIKRDLFVYRDDSLTVRGLTCEPNDQLKCWTASEN